MARTTTLTVVLNLTTKKATFTGQIAVRENVNLSITGYGTAGATDLVVGLVHDGTLIAVKQGLTTGTAFTGVLNLNTIEAVAVFSGMAANAKVKCSFVIWDITNDCLLCCDWLQVENNPYDEDMEDPTATDTIGGVEYAPKDQGVTNGDSHTHQSGDGADLSTYYIKCTPAGAFFKQSSNKLDIMLRDRLNGQWRPLILYNGALSVGPAE